MERVTLRLPQRQVREIDEMVEEGKYSSRSEAIRSAVREMLAAENDNMSSKHGTKELFAKK